MTDKATDKKSIISSTMIVSLIAVFIKFLGLIKQSVLAAYCGATEETDIFFVASGVLVSLSTMIFSAISVSLLTMHTDKLLHEGRESANDLINKALRYFLPVSVSITLFFVVAAPLVANFLAPSYSAEQLAIMTKYIRMMSVVFVLWNYFLTMNVVLETDKRFIPGRGQGLFQNIFLIFSAIYVYSRTGIDSLIWSFILSGVAECVLVSWCARKQFRVIWGKLNTPTEDIRKLFRISVPLILGSAVYEVNDIVDKQISSSLGEGCVSYLTYGSTINEIVTGVIVMAMSTVLFTHFAAWVSEGNLQKMEHTLKISLTYLTLTIFPILTLCTFGGDDIVRIFYARGSFGETEIYNTYWVSVGYASGFVFSSVQAVLVKVLYAFKDTRRAMINGIASVTLNIILSITISRYVGVWGISLATSIAMLFSIIFMHYQIRHHIPNLNFISEIGELLKGAVAFVVSSASMLYITNTIIIQSVFISFLSKSILCISVYVVTLILLRANCAIMILNNIKKTKR